MSLVEKFARDLTDRLDERSPMKAMDIVSFETENIGKWKGALIMIFSQYSLNIPVVVVFIFFFSFVSLSRNDGYVATYIEYLEGHAVS